MGDMGNDVGNTGNVGVVSGCSDLRGGETVMTKEQRDNAKAMCRMIALKMPMGIMKHMLQRAARDASTDDVVRKIDEHTLLVIHYTLDFWEAGRAHAEMIR